MMGKSKMPLYSLDNIETPEQEEKETSLVAKARKLPFSLKKRTFGKFAKSRILHREVAQNLPGMRESMMKFERVKTIYGHAILGEQGMSISCIEFDHSNKYIITGSDDKLIKIWLSLNGSLQGVLCGHEGSIIDLHVSACNRYIISAGKDGLVIIWDLKLCTKLHVCKEHKGPVNQVKTVYTKLATSEHQLLYTCGDDGLINIYNLDKIGKTGREEDEFENLVKTRRAKPRVPKDPLFLFSLSSIEFTGLKKDKKVDSIEFSNRRGLLFSGCYGGELLIWRNDNYRRDRFTKEAYELVAKIKSHDQILHLIAISPDDNYFMTGDTDGRVNIWRPPETVYDINELIGDMGRDRNPGGNKNKASFKKHLVKTIEGSPEFSRSQCDSIEWSCRGRYALASFGGKEEKSNTEKSIIYVWDQRKQEVIHQLGSRPTGITLENFTFVLEAHPKDENYFMSGGGAGRVILWEISSGTQLKSFKEFGHYHRDYNILDEIFDGKFSSCGNFFVVSTIWGTFSIYTVFSNESYLATPIEQFFHLDKTKDMESDIYNETRPMMVNFDRFRNAEQPPLPLLGDKKFIEEKDLSTNRYNLVYNERFDRNRKDHLFYEEYAREHEPYFYLNSRNDENQSNEEEDNENSGSSNNEENKRDRPAYYDRHNDEFDRESDEDFIVDLENRNNGVRRMPRRTDSRPPAPPRNPMPDSGQRQRRERERRRRERNRRRGGEEQSDEDDYIIHDMVENEESEPSVEFMIKEEEDPEYSEVRPNLMYNPRSPINEVDSIEEEEEIIETHSAHRVDSQQIPLPSSSRIISDEGIEDAPILQSGHYSSINDDEDYKFEQNMEDRGYKIDIEEAQKMMRKDKSSLDCGLCKKKGGESSLIGPFKFFIKDQATDEMVYWFHRECLERNDIVQQKSKYEFENIQECVNHLILNEGNECSRCFTAGASISCMICKEFYHGFRCSFLRLGYDYDGNLICIKCLKDRLRSQLTDEYLDQVDKKLMENNVYKNMNRKMFYEELPGIFTPQIDDEAYFIFQAYEEVVGYYMNHFFTLEENRDKPMDDYLSKFLTLKLTDQNDLTHKPLRCKISNIEYRLPSATTIEVNQKVNSANQDYVIESELTLKIMEPAEYEGMEFRVIYFNHSTLEESISMNYLVPANEYIQSISEEELNEVAGQLLKPADQHDPKIDMLEITDFEPEVYPNCNFKCIFFKQVNNTNLDGHRLRVNALGRNKSLNIGRLSIWDVKRASATSTPVKDDLQKTYIENRGFKSENYFSAFEEASINKLAETIEAYIRNNASASLFMEAVTDEMAPDYLNIVAVEMNLHTIRDNLYSNHYRSKQMVLKDLKLIEDNCVEFNGEEAKISKDAKNVNDTLKKTFVIIFNTKLRGGPRRSSSNRSRGNSSEHEVIAKRNPKKVTRFGNRNTRQRSEVDYKDESEEEKAFKKPTPQKIKRRMLDEDSEQSVEESNFKINLDLNPQPDTSLRRSSRNRNRVSLKEPDTPPEGVRVTRQRLKKRERKEDSKNSRSNGSSNGLRNQSPQEYSEFSDNYGEPFADEDY